MIKHVKFLIFFIGLIAFLPLINCASALEYTEPGRVNYYHGNYERALEFLLEGQQKYPNNLEILIWIGKCYGKLNRINEMIDVFDKISIIEAQDDYNIYGRKISEIKDSYYQEFYSNAQKYFEEYIKEKENKTDSSERSLQLSRSNILNAIIIYPKEEALKLERQIAGSM